MFDPAEAVEHRARLTPVNLRLVGLVAPLDVLELRKRNAAAGLSSWHAAKLPTYTMEPPTISKSLRAAGVRSSYQRGSPPVFW